MVIILFPPSPIGNIKYRVLRKRDGTGTEPNEKFLHFRLESLKALLNK